MKEGKTLHLIEIHTTHDGQELARHGSLMFPLAMYHNGMDQYGPGGVAWHWHDEVEMDVVLQGRMKVGVGDKTVTLEAGEGVFVNAGALHSFMPAEEGGKPGVFWGVVFSADLIAGAPHSLFERKYVRPLLRCAGAEGIILRPGVRWQEAVLADLSRLDAAWEAQEFGFELEMRDCLSQAWRRMAAELRPGPNTPGERADDGRIKRVLSFIHSSYMNDISLEDIAAHVSVSARECSRSFKNHLGMTPYAYLVDYRVRVAAALLAETDRSVTDICYAVGFNGTSYFGKVFREATRCSPREYRLRERGKKEVRRGCGQEEG